MYVAFGLVVTSLAPLTGLVEADLGLSHAAMGSIMGAWQLVFIFSSIPCGILLDRLGPRWALTLGGLLMAASTLLRGTADSYAELLLAVMLFGVGGPIISAGAPKVVTTLFSGSSRGLAMGIYMTGPAIGGVVSLTMTHSLLLPQLDGQWRNVMVLWAGFAALITLVWVFVAAHPSLNRTSLDASNASAPPQSQRQIIKSILGTPAVVLVLMMGVGVFLFNHGLNNWLPELLRQNGMSVVAAGYWAAIPTVIGILGSLLIPRLATPKRRIPILIGLSLCAAAASLLLQVQNEPILFSGLLLQGIARSALMTVLILTLVELPGIGDRYAGVASGLFFASAEVGGMLGPLTLGLLYDFTGGFNAGLYLLTAVGLTLALGARRLHIISSREPAAASF
ncbi:MAG: CP family cyanate transporter-like MFS transporter [Candidatus Pseudothioglobus sp.]|jgi:cyanate permease